ncbi:MAG TPA: hypothetical protein VHM02_11990 [Thermoanaerobaculia bacterium]|nr:hypothetical protein [Thermoanaerobaculia bacterium]
MKSSRCSLFPSSVFPLLAFGALAGVFSPSPVAAQTLPCAPCAGLVVDSSSEAERIAAELSTVVDVERETAVFVGWNGGAAGDGAAVAEAVRGAGATPWVRLVFTAPPPLAEAGEPLELEIAAAAAVARAVGDAWFQVDWRPDGGAEVSPGELAYLVKRVAVALSGAAARARVAVGPVPAQAGFVRALYAAELAGYLEALAVAPAGAEALGEVAAALGEVDPGRPLVVVGAPLPEPAIRALAAAARNAAAGAAATLFEKGDAAPAEAVVPLAVVARELSGDVTFDPYATPAGAPAWVFVRGEDLGLRVIAEAPAGPGGQPPDELTLAFPDPQLTAPARVDPVSGEAVDLFSGRRAGGGYQVTVADPDPVTVLRLGRLGVEELGEGGGVEERLEVAGERQVAVEEILRRLQAFEDAQARRIEHYGATNTTHLRFGVGAGPQSFEATLEGPYFFDPETGADWAWQTFFVNGVRWRGRTIPEIPLVQPEKAAAMPGEITFDRTYRYTLRGTETVDGREAWVVDFAPAEPLPAAAAEAEGDGAGAPSPAPSLYRGTVWIDRELSARVRTRAVQLGLTGEVISNEETLHYRPIDAAGEPAPWAPESFVLPLRVVSQQLLSVVNATTLVERETLLSGVTINGADFAERRAAVAASPVTMVRDTERGLRYLVPDEDGGERVVKEGFDTDKWFLVGGVFADDAIDYPLPLGGINYLDLDFRGSGGQLNAFFAGALLTVNVADPRVAGSRWDAGADLFAIAVPFADTVWRDDEEIEAEEVESRPASVGLKLGRPVGSFGKLSAEYRLLSREFSSTDETADDFAVPSDHLEHALGLSGRYARGGWSLGGNVGYSRRSEWEPWGLPGTAGFSADHEDFLYWGASLEKTWHLAGFEKIGAELAYVDGQDLDRFSKYGFGFFGDTRVHGYQSGKVRAERAYLAHASYGFEIGQLLRLDALADVAWATDEESGLDNETLAGVGIAGTFVGPWQTLINLDVGVPVAGPDDGFVAYVVFLKLFR